MRSGQNDKRETELAKRKEVCFLAPSITRKGKWATTELSSRQATQLAFSRMLVIFSNPSTFVTADFSKDGEEKIKKYDEAIKMSESLNNFIFQSVFEIEVRLLSFISLNGVLRAAHSTIDTVFTQSSLCVCMCIIETQLRELNMGYDQSISDSLYFNLQKNFRGQNNRNYSFRIGISINNNKSFILEFITSTDTIALSDRTKQ